MLQIVNRCSIGFFGPCATFLFICVSSALIREDINVTLKKSNVFNLDRAQFLTEFNLDFRKANKGQYKRYTAIKNLIYLIFEEI